MLVHRMNRFAGGQTQIQSITTQPHGEWLILYEGLQNRLLVVQVLRGLQVHCCKSRSQLKRNQQYSIDMQIPQALRIQPYQTNEGINQIIVTERQSDQQTILLVNITLIEAITINIKSFQIVRRKLYILPFQIIQADSIGHNLYVSMFNITMAVIPLNKQCPFYSKNQAQTKIAVTAADFITKQSKSTQKIVQFTQIKRLTQKIEFEPNLWQTICGFLMYGDQIIGSQFTENLNMSNSLDEYTYRQHNQFFPIKYQFSSCRHYLVGSQYAKTISASEQGRYNIRSRLGNWGEAFQTKYRPEVNPYWTYYQKFRRESNKNIEGKRIKLGKNDSDTILIAYYKRQEHRIVVSRVEANYQQRKKITDVHIEKDTGREVIQTKTKFKSEEIALLSLKNVKRRLSGIKWIGLNQFLYIQENQYLYFAEFEQSYLQNFL